MQTFAEIFIVRFALFFYIRNAVMVDYVFSYLNGYNGNF